MISRYKFGGVVNNLLINNSNYSELKNTINQFQNDLFTNNRSSLLKRFKTLNDVERKVYTLAFTQKEFKEEDKEILTNIVKKLNETTPHVTTSSIFVRIVKFVKNHFFGRISSEKMINKIQNYREYKSIFEKLKLSIIFLKEEKKFLAFLKKELNVKREQIAEIADNKKNEYAKQIVGIKKLSVSAFNNQTSALYLHLGKILEDLSALSKNNFYNDDAFENQFSNIKTTVEAKIKYDVITDKKLKERLKIIKKEFGV